MLFQSDKRKVVCLLTVSLLLRLAFFSYGIYQDSHYVVKYTDIDYHVFNDAAAFVYRGLSPYGRDTYRYTPLLSWIFLLNQYTHSFHLTKLVFIIFDLLNGVLLLELLSSVKLAAMWLLNPMVITISTRGNAEAVLCFLILSSLLAFRNGRYVLGSVVYGLSIHFKIYPIIYALPISIYLWERSTPTTEEREVSHSHSHFYYYISHYKSQIRTLIQVGSITLLTILSLTAIMYALYGYEFLDQTYLYHIYRLDHRHNFSIWNQLLYLDSARGSSSSSSSSSPLVRLAFLPQLLIVCVLGSYRLWLKNPKPRTTNRDNYNQEDIVTLAQILFLQTFAFVTYNKVVTSQYFIWYLLLLPFWLSGAKLGVGRLLVMLAVWFGAQALWLYEGYELEFLGLARFFPGLFLGSVVFLLANVWVVGECIYDMRVR